MQARGADLGTLPEGETSEPRLLRAARRLDDPALRGVVATTALIIAAVAATIGGFLVSPRVGWFVLAGALLLVAVSFGFGNDTAPPMPDERL